MSLHPATQAWLHRVVGSFADIGDPLTGGVTSSVHAVAGGLVVKQVGNQQWLRDRPDVVAYEARVLDWLSSSTIPAPAVVAVDPDGAAAGLPTLVLEALPGGPAGEAEDPARWLPGIAELSARVSALECPDWIRPFARYQDPAQARPPAWAGDAEVWHRAIATAGGPPPLDDPALIHRDYHPWNVLVSRGISGLVDWSQTSVGPAAVDASHCRANLAIAFDADTADRYRTLWEHCSGRTFDPYWDVVTCIDFLPDWRPSAPENAKLEGWVHRVLAEMTAGS